LRNSTSPLNEIVSRGRRLAPHCQIGSLDCAWVRTGARSVEVLRASQEGVQLSAVIVRLEGYGRLFNIAQLQELICGSSTGSASAGFRDLGSYVDAARSDHGPFSVDLGCCRTVISTFWFDNPENQPQAQGRRTGVSALPALHRRNLCGFRHPARGRARPHGDSRNGKRFGGWPSRALTRHGMPHPWRFHGWAAMPMGSGDFADVKLRFLGLIDQNRAAFAIGVMSEAAP
jgi:hypothetical protein